MNWIDTNTLIAICTCVIGLTQFLFWRYIAKNKAYESEKGKNLATKEDIGKITKEIESVKASYNESLERHKIELQKEFEAHKYVSNLCNSLDNSLLELISECLKAESSTEIDDDKILISKTCKLTHFLWTYKKRYESNRTISRLIDISRQIETEKEGGVLEREKHSNGYTPYKIGRADKEKLLKSLEAVLSLFLPSFEENKPKP